MTVHLTVAHLKAEYACSPQVKEFESRYPEGVEVTEDQAVSVSYVFDWDWAAENLLTEDGRDQYEASKAREFAKAAIAHGLK